MSDACLMVYVLWFHACLMVSCLSSGLMLVLWSHACLMVSCMFSNFIFYGAQVFYDAQVLGPGPRTLGTGPGPGPRAQDPGHRPRAQAQGPHEKFFEIFPQAILGPGPLWGLLNAENPGNSPAPRPNPRLGRDKPVVETPHWD